MNYFFLGLPTWFEWGAREWELVGFTARSEGSNSGEHYAWIQYKDFVVRLRKL